MRHAAHYLLCAGYYLPWPLVEVFPDGRIELSQFSQECSGTVFHSGVLEIDSTVSSAPFFSASLPLVGSLHLPHSNDCIGLEEMRRYMASLPPFPTFRLFSLDDRSM